ncbi:MAG: hypothetical protein ACPLN0_07710 [Candidatus Hydrothermia bacterium]
MMEIILNESQVEILRKIIKDRILELRAEIRKADDSVFKEELRKEKEILKEILLKLGEEID